MDPRSTGRNRVTLGTLCLPGFYMQRTCPSEQDKYRHFLTKIKQRICHQWTFKKCSVSSFKLKGYCTR